ncbi:MAG: response regulator [Chloroflexota bacterium]
MDGRKQRILIVDDEEVIRLVLETALCMDGYVVYQATDGAEGLQKATEVIPDLIITDVTMPGLNGYDLMEQVRHTALLSHIPVIMLTAKRDDELDPIRATPDEYLTKPFSLSDLYAKVRGLLSGISSGESL